MKDFKPVLCQRCGTVVWTGYSWVGFLKMLDVKRLTIEEEIIKRVNGVMTYEAFKTKVSFEVVERSLLRIQASRPKPERIILADHQCSNYQLFDSIENAPNYWAVQNKPVTVSTGEFPF